MTSAQFSALSGGLACLLLVLAVAFPPWVRRYRLPGAASPAAGDTGDGAAGEQRATGKAV
ncbi:MAG: hypothetical protein U0531_01480 [Dehalococcoidia bacterium]